MKKYSLFVFNKKVLIAGLTIILLCSFCFIPNLSPSSSPANQITIVIDPGHGGIDPGGIGITTKVKESDINLAISKILKQYLSAININVVLTRTTSDGLYGNNTKGYKKRDMLARKNIILNNKADMVVSVHMNRYIKSSMRGAQVFYNPNSKSGQALALCIQNNFSKNLPKSDKGVSIGEYYMLNCTSAPSVICECGYLSNPEDELLLTTPEYQDKVAYNIFCGIVEYLNLTTTIN